MNAESEEKKKKKKTVEEWGRQEPEHLMPCWLSWGFLPFILKTVGTKELKHDQIYFGEDSWEQVAGELGVDRREQ